MKMTISPVIVSRAAVRKITEPLKAAALEPEITTKEPLFQFWSWKIHLQKRELHQLDTPLENA
jgi:hypothetical protein